jgi:hypothetical protein
MLSRDPELKRQRGYTDPKSYVRNDGSEVLYREDWKRRKREIWERGNGKCERIVSHTWVDQTETIERCRNEMKDPHHIKPRSKGRDDRASNLIGLCRLHHDLLDERKPRWTKSTKR